MDSIKDNRNTKSKKRQNEKSHIMKLEKQLNTQVNRLKQKAQAIDGHLHNHDEDSSPDRKLEKVSRKTERRIEGLEEKLGQVSKIRKNGKVSKGKVTQKISDF